MHASRSLRTRALCLLGNSCLALPWGRASVAWSSGGFRACSLRSFGLGSRRLNVALSARPVRAWRSDHDWSSTLAYQPSVVARFDETFVGFEDGWRDFLG